MNKGIVAPSLSWVRCRADVTQTTFKGPILPMSTPTISTLVHPRHRRELPPSTSPGVARNRHHIIAPTLQMGLVVATS